MAFIAAVTVTTIAASTAAAVTTVELIKQSGPRSEHITFVRGDGTHDQIKVSWLGHGDYAVASKNRARGDRCRSLRRGRLRCHLVRGVGVLELYGRAGSDRLSLIGRFPEEIAGITGNAGPDRIHGGIGSEVLTGSQGDDEINGGAGQDFLGGESNNILRPSKPGDDTLRGGPGRDELGDYYEFGADRFFGGPGRDVVDATDRARDEVIRGGPGRDLCRIDRVDPKPASCEQTRIVPPSPYDRSLKEQG